MPGPVGMGDGRRGVGFLSFLHSWSLVVFEPFHFPFLFFFLWDQAVAAEWFRLGLELLLHLRAAGTVPEFSSVVGKCHK